MLAELKFKEALLREQYICYSKMLEHFPRKRSTHKAFLFADKELTRVCKELYDLNKQLHDLEKSKKEKF